MNLYRNKGCGLNDYEYFWHKSSLEVKGHTLGIFFFLILKLSVSFHRTLCSRVRAAVVMVGQRGLSPW